MKENWGYVMYVRWIMVFIYLFFVFIDHMADEARSVLMVILVCLNFGWVWYSVFCKLFKRHGFMFKVKLISWHICYLANIILVVIASIAILFSDDNGGGGDINVPTDSNLSKPSNFPGILNRFMLLHACLTAVFMLMVACWTAPPFNIGNEWWYDIVW